MLLIKRKWQHASAAGCRARKRLVFLHFKAFFCSPPQFPVTIRRRRNAGEARVRCLGSGLTNLSCFAFRVTTWCRSLAKGLTDVQDAMAPVAASRTIRRLWCDEKITWCSGS